MGSLSGVRLLGVASTTRTRHGQRDLRESLQDTCRTSVDWRSCMCQMGAKVERCRSPWCTGSLQDDDPKRGRRCSTSDKIDDDAYYDRRTPWGAAVHCGRGGHPGLLPLSFQEKQGAMINLRTNKLHLPHLRAVVPMDRTQGRHCTIDVTTGLTPVTFRVPGEVSHQFVLSWHQFVMGGTVENSIRDGNDQLVMKDETKNMCRVTESIQKKHGKISKQTVHLTSPQGSVTINHQDKIVGQDNDHLHLTDSHFSQDDQRCDNSSSLSHDTGPISLSDAITSVDLTTWGPDVRCHNQSGRSMGSTDTTAVVTTRRGLARATQVWQDGRHDRTFNVLAPHLSTTKGSESICQMGKLHEMSAKTLDGEARVLEGGEGSTRESSGEGGNGQKDGGTEEQSFSDPLQDGLGHESGFPLSNR